MSCTNLDGEFAPFCRPTNRAELDSTNKVQVSWDTSFFQNASSDLLRIQVNYTSEDGSETDVAQAGFASPWLRTYTGTYGWNIQKGFLSDGQSIMAQLYIVTSDDSIKGPEIKLVAPTESASGDRETPKVNPAVIAVPVVLGTLLMGLIAVYLFKRRRNPEISLRDMFKRREGYGIKKSKGERTTAMQMGGMMGNASAVVPSGRNVFREEMKRQDEEARG